MRPRTVKDLPMGETKNPIDTTNPGLLRAQAVCRGDEYLGTVVPTASTIDALLRLWFSDEDLKAAVVEGNLPAREFLSWLIAKGHAIAAIEKKWSADLEDHWWFIAAPRFMAELEAKKKAVQPEAASPVVKDCSLGSNNNVA